MKPFAGTKTFLGALLFAATLANAHPPEMPAGFEKIAPDRGGTLLLGPYLKFAASAPAGATEFPREAPAPRNAALADMAAQAEKILKAADKNADGQITREEAGSAPWFARLDRDGDGIISAGEWSTLRRILAQRADTRNGFRGEPKAAPAVSRGQVQAVTSGPELVKPGAVGVGRMVEDVAFTLLEGRATSLAGFQAKKGLVVLMTSTTCPVSKRYLPGVAALEKELAARDVALLLVNPLASETTEALKVCLAEAGVTSPCVRDPERKLSATLGARTTTEVFLLDASRTLIYRGALDDQYGANYSHDTPRHRYLQDAVAALLQSQKPVIEATAAPGCELDLPDADATPSDPSRSPASITYHKDIARILGQHCVSCHRAGGIAPFALDDIAEVRDRARVIKRVVSEGTMPPWFAAAEAHEHANPWANDCSLSARDKADLLSWIDSRDRPAGDPADAPLKREHPAEWSIGTPDLIVPLSRAFDIKADGWMPYAFDVVTPNITMDQWVAAYEILPSERDVVHHVIVQVHEKGADTRDREEGAGGYWAAYVPGNGAHIYPQGFARKLPAGARLSFQIHYTPSGRAKKERLRLGLVFAKTPPQWEVRTAAVANRAIAIPPGASDHVEVKTQRVPFDMPVTSLLAHMHVRGKAFRYEVTFPEGNTETLLDIPRYDFNWQLRYDYKRPRLIPRGSTVRLTAVYDNSAQNKANPDPTQRVKWGAQTFDEMMIGYFEYFLPLPTYPPFQ